MARSLRGGCGGQLDQPGLTAQLVRRDRLVVGTALALLTALAWLHLARMPAGMDGAGGMAGMSGMAMPQTGPWSATDFAALFAMWSVMMVAMMLPSAAPTVLLVTGMARRREERGAPAVHAGAFLMGYLAAWIGFSAVAALAQWLLHRAALLSPMMASASPRLSGAILVGAGLYQWLPFKHACLSHCRSPMHWLGSGWREGARGAFGMGVHHGTYCLACCWLLMALLFVAGVMNLVWVAAIAVLVLLEKVSPPGRVVARVAGVAMAAWGVALLIGAV